VCFTHTTHTRLLVFLAGVKRKKSADVEGESPLKKAKESTKVTKVCASIYSVWVSHVICNCFVLLH